MPPTRNLSFSLRKIKKKYRWIKKNDWILLLWNEERRIKQKKNVRRYSDREAVKRLYFNAFGTYPDFKNPEGYNEKLQWLKLYYRDPLMVQCADKYGVREHVKKTGYGHILNDLYGTYDGVEAINIGKLPDRFVLKATHGSGWNIICRDKASINWFAWKLIMKSWLRQNIYVDGREWVYNDIKPRIICEKYLEDSNGNLTDYKFFCFNGEPAFIQVDIDRFGMHKRNMYDTEWNLLPFTYNYLNADKEIDRPYNLGEMLTAAKQLSAGFPHVRVDFYNVNGRLFFGEFTFFPGSGTEIFTPREYDMKIGKLLYLPGKNFFPEEKEYS